MSNVEQRHGQAALVGRAGRTRLGQPRIWHKLAVIGSAFMLPLAASSCFLALENDRRTQFSQNELRGLEYLRPLGSLLVDLGRHKTLSRQVLTGERSAEQLRQCEARVDAAFAALMAAERRLGRHLRTTADHLDGGATPAGLVLSWQTLLAAEPELTSSDAAHTALTGERMQSAYRAVTDLRELTTHGFVLPSTVVLDRSAYLRAVDVATEAVSTLWIAIQDQETGLLQLRLAREARIRTLGAATVLAVLVSAVLLAIWLSWAFNSMAARLDEIVEELRQSQRTLRAERDFVDAVLDVTGSLVLVLDRAGRIVRFNRACEVATGYSFAEVEGRLFEELLAPTDVPSRMTASIAMLLERGLRGSQARSSLTPVPAAGFPTSFEDMLLTRDQRCRRVAWSNTSLLDDAGAVTHVIATGIDITEGRTAEKGLREAQERFRLAFDNAPIGMCLIARDGCFMQVNQALCEMLGYRERELLERTVADITHPEDIAKSRKAIADLAAGCATTFHSEGRYLHADGHVLWAMISVSTFRSADGGPGYAVAQIQDITERRAAEQQLVHQATHDPLTGLPNRLLLMDRLRMALTRSRHEPAACTAVLFIDLDGFKAVNDRLGHDAADRVLVEVGRRLRQSVRPLDTVTRLGGDEFVIMCQDVSPAEPGTVVEIGERLVAAFVRPIMIDTVEVAVTASIGIAYATGAHVTAEALIRDADTAMYRAKGCGKNRYEVFDETLRGPATDRGALERALRRGLREERFRLFFQPVVDVRTAAPVAVEALVRLDDTERGLVTPEKFIELAEDTGLTVPIGAWAIADACRQLANWQSGKMAPEGLHVAVNLSVRQASCPDLVDVVVLALVDAALPPHALALEVPESVLVEADAATVRQFGHLRDLGIRLGIDDFGTSPSSLTYLKRSPVSFLKIGSSFVSGLVDNPSDREIVTAVIQLAHALGIVTIAEGVEDSAQLALLQELGCDQAQGYLFGRPRPGPPDVGRIEHRTSSGLVEMRK